MSHPFYVSICEINQNKTEQTLEITIKLFADDLDKVLKQNTGEKVNLGLSDENENADEYLSEYLEQNLQIKVNDKAIKFNYLGKEMEGNEDALWVYLEVEKVKKVKSIAIVNKILLDLEESQVNLIHLKVEGKKKSMLLNMDKQSDSFSIN